MVITNCQIEKLFNTISEVEYVKVEGDGYHYKLMVVSDLFIDKSKLERHKWVYAILNKHILSGALHALQMQTLTKHEWEKQCG
jgi:acid stress-induced BolA-like protein IbaG/YrbA